MNGWATLVAQTFCGAGSAALKEGYAVHVYTFNADMDRSCLVGERERREGGGEGVYTVDSQMCIRQYNLMKRDFRTRFSSSRCIINRWHVKFSNNIASWFQVLKFLSSSSSRKVYLAFFTTQRDDGSTRVKYVQPRGA